MAPPRRRWIRRPPPPDPYVVEERVVEGRDPRWIFLWLLAIGVFAALLLFLFFATRDDDDPPRAAPASVPRVLGLDHVDAGGRIEATRLVPDTFPVEHTRPAGQVVAQSPRPGATAPAGSTVRLEVSRGPTPSAMEIRVPNVTGLRAPEARALLRRGGLTVRTERREAEAVGQVLRQQPQEGAVAAPFDQVTLIVGR